MSQSRAQLVSPVGILTITGADVSGIVTASSFFGDGSQLTGVGVGSISSVNTTGIITAASFYGDGSNLTGVGVGTTSSINTTGIITASAFVGDGAELTGISGPISGITFSPADEATDVAIDTNIVITFNKLIKAGVGTISLREGSASGTVVESYDVSSSGNLTFSGSNLTINPTSNLGYATTYYAVIPEGTISDVVGLSTNTTIDTYNFTTVNLVAPLFGWGVGGDGELAQSDRTPYSSPVQIPGTQWSSVSIWAHTLATKTDGTLWAWGYNLSGQLGQGDEIRHSSPVQIPGTSWSSVSGGNSISLATKTDGTLWAWGRNLEGQLGQDITIFYSSPVQIPGTSWSSVFSSQSSSLATKTDGTLWAFGANEYGNLAQNNLTEYSSPVQIPGNQWSSVSSGGASQHLLATKTDGTFWSWGRNERGQLGQNNRTYYSSPVQIPGNQWSFIDSGAAHSLATKSDGTLWAWGDNTNGAATAVGQLGQNNGTPYSSPVQIPGTTWSSVGTGLRHSFAIKTDGTLWAWGRNTAGNLGQNSTSYGFSSPVQIPGTQWNFVTGGDNNSISIKSE